MGVPEKYIYTDDDGTGYYDYCESGQRPILQIMIDGQGVCEYCKSPNQIMICKAPVKNRPPYILSLYIKQNKGD